MKYLLNLSIALLLLFSRCSKPVSGYEITGTVSGLPDNSWLYLSQYTPEKNIDSCQIKGGKFSMTGKISERAMPAYLHTADNVNGIQFWLENTAITIQAKADSFAAAGINGSYTENENRLFNKQNKPLESKFDSLYLILGTLKDSNAKEQVFSQLRVIEKDIELARYNYVRNHPNSVLSASLLSENAIIWGRDTSVILFNKMAKDIKVTNYGVEISRFISINKNIKVGSMYADFEQANTLGKSIKLSDIRGRYTLLDFWASWCHPCRSENLNLVKTYNKFKYKGFAILGVSADDDKQEWLNAVKNDKLTWENVCDLRADRNEAAIMYGVYAFPTNFLINDKGIIIAQNLRGKALDDKLTQLLDGSL